MTNMGMVRLEEKEHTRNGNKGNDKSFVEDGVLPHIVHIRNGMSVRILHGTTMLPFNQQNNLAEDIEAWAISVDGKRRYALASSEEEVIIAHHLGLLRECTNDCDILLLPTNTTEYALLKTEMFEDESFICVFDERNSPLTLLDNSSFNWRYSFSGSMPFDMKLYEEISLLCDVNQLLLKTGLIISFDDIKLDDVHHMKRVAALSQALLQDALKVRLPVVTNHYSDEVRALIGKVSFTKECDVKAIADVTAVREALGDVSQIWYQRLNDTSVRLFVKESDLDDEQRLYRSFRDIAEVFGIDSCLSAYGKGVPIRDILA